MITDQITEGKPADEIGALLAERFGASLDPLAGPDPVYRLAADQVIACVTALRDEHDLQFDTLLEITGIDHLSFPGWRDERFAVVYILKSTSFRHRVMLKVLVEEDEAEVPSLSELYANANWLERETWDQYGISFVGHPNLKRLLNHRAFVGHPLRKDYPVQKRQYLDYNDPMIGELVDELEGRGYAVLDKEQVLQGETEGEQP